MLQLSLPLVGHGLVIPGVHPLPLGSAPTSHHCSKTNHTRGPSKQPSNPVRFGNLGFNCQLIIVVQTFLVSGVDADAGNLEAGGVSQCQGLGWYRLGWSSREWKENQLVF